MSRKDRKNFGFTTTGEQEPAFDGPGLAEARVSIVMPERILFRMLRDEVERLRNDDAELDRFFRFFFATLDPTERASYASHFRKFPPTVVFGYPRSGVDFPVMSIVLSSEELSQDALGQYMGETLDGEDAPDGAAEYVGAIFESTWTVFIYAQNPDACLYLYNLAKMVVLGGTKYLIQGGLMDPRISGEDLGPAGEEYLPENMFMRALRITAQHQVTVPVLATPDPGRARLGGLFREDVTVDGYPGAVYTYVGKRDDGDEG